MNITALLFAEGGGWSWANYPGLELWKFFNLAVFTTVMIFIARRKVSGALLLRRESIRADLQKAKEEREKALQEFGEAEALLVRLDGDVKKVQEQASQEAEAERRRLAQAAERETEKLKQQAEREIETTGKVARQELKQFLAKRSVELARQTITSRIGAEEDTRLIEQGIGELRRSRV